MKSKLLVCVSVLFTVLSHACEDNNLRIVTIESQYNSQNIILDDNDKTKLDLFLLQQFHLQQSPFSLTRRYKRSQPHAIFNTRSDK